jgi:hypothetical protein
MERYFYHAYPSEYNHLHNFGIGRYFVLGCLHQKLWKLFNFGLCLPIINLTLNEFDIAENVAHHLKYKYQRSTAFI